MRGNGNKTTVGDPYCNKWGPRSGSLINLTPKTVVRGGYGVFFAPQFAIGAPIATVGYNQQHFLHRITNNNLTAANLCRIPFRPEFCSRWANHSAR